MSALNESFARIELPPASGEAALPVIMPAQKVDRSITAAAIAAPAPARRHSGFGIASLGLSLLTGGGEFLLVALSALMVATNPNLDATSPLSVGLGLLMCAGIPASLLGAALDIVSMFEKQRHKVFPILGLGFNAAVVLGMGLLFVIGSQMPSGPGPGS